MTFESLQEVKEYFGLTDDDINEIRKQLKGQLANLHPDKFNGEFPNKKQQRDFEDLNNAIEFIDNISDESVTIPKNEWAVVLRKIEELSIINKRSEISNENQYAEILNTSINTSIITFHKKHSFLRISSIAIAGVLTILWGFPQIALNHPVLKQFISVQDPAFNFTWFFCLLFSVFTWVQTKNLEGKDDQIKKTYNLEGTQNNMFKLFIAWMVNVSPQSREFDEKDHSSNVFFTKDDLVNFITNHYQVLNREFEELLPVENHYRMVDNVSNRYKDNKRGLLKKYRSANNPINLFFKKPGDIDIDLGQKISDTIISKLLSRNIIITSGRKTYSETYMFNYHYS